jgi:hypothetical protein
MTVASNACRGSKGKKHGMNIYRDNKHASFVGGALEIAVGLAVAVAVFLTLVVLGVV